MGISWNVWTDPLDHHLQEDGVEVRVPGWEPDDVVQSDPGPPPGGDDVLPRLCYRELRS